MSDHQEREHVIAGRAKRDELFSLLEQGVDLSDIAARLGVTEFVVRRVSRYFGFRGPPPRQASERNILAQPENLARLKEMLKGPLTLKELGAPFGVTGEHVRMFLKLNDMTRPPRTMASVHPELSAVWSERNPPMSEVSPTSTESFWWKTCDRHQRKMSLNFYMRNRDKPCPHCVGTMPLLVDVCPALAEQFHPTRNPGIVLGDIRRASGLNVWWVCDEGHEFKAVVRNRAVNGSGCPTCFANADPKKYAGLAKSWGWRRAAPTCE